MAGLASRRVNHASGREVVPRLTPAGQQNTGDLTARRQAETAAIVGRMLPRQRAGLVRALRAFTGAGAGPPPTTQARDQVPSAGTSPPPDCERHHAGPGVPPIEFGVVTGRCQPAPGGYPLPGGGRSVRGRAG